MTEKIVPIPARIKNMAQGGHVAGAVDIFDDNLLRDQQTINASQRTINDNTYRKDETYSKEQLNNMITTPDQEYLTVIATDQTTSLSDVATLIATQYPDGKESADTIYRVGNWDGTEYNTNVYSEYAWDGITYQLLSVKEPGFDEEPIKDSDNIVTSGGVAKYMRSVDSNSGYVYLIKDNENKILVGIKANGNTDTVLGHSKSDVNLNYVELTLDKENKIVSARRTDGTLVENKIEVEDIVLGETAEEYIKNLIATDSVSSNNFVVDTNGWILPQSDAERAMIQKGHEIMDFEWTPKRDVPKTGKAGGGTLVVFTAGSPIVGIPYSGTQEIDKVVGFDVSMETYATAANNPYSLLYTECIRKDEYQYSAWGRTYHGIPSAGAYMGSVCAEHAAFCAGLPMPIKTGSMAGKVGQIIGRTLQQNESPLQIGDLIWQPGHCISIEGVKRNEKGEVIGVIVSEQSSTTPQKTRRTIYEDLDNVEDYITPQSGVNDVATYKLPFSDKELPYKCFISILEGNHVIYRNLRFDKNTDKRPFYPEDYTYNNDICTFLGDKACFREGELVVLNYNLDENETYNWTEIEVYKDNELYDTIVISEIDQSSLAENVQYHSAVLGTNLPYGNYKARMKNGNTYSDYTYFIVVQTTVSYSIINSNTTLRCTFSSANADIAAIRITSLNGSVYREHYMIDKELSEGKALIDISTMTGTRYLKVYFETDYGRVTNEPILIDWESGGDDDDDDDDD